MPYNFRREPENSGMTLRTITNGIVFKTAFNVSKWMYIKYKTNVEKTNHSSHNSMVDKAI